MYFHCDDDGERWKAITCILTVMMGTGWRHRSYFHSNDGDGGGGGGTISCIFTMTIEMGMRQSRIEDSCTLEKWS